MCILDVGQHPTDTRGFDLSEFMRHVQSAFVRWYSKTYQRRGRFWADRFKSVHPETTQAVQDCLLHVELNPVVPVW